MWLFLPAIGRRFLVNNMTDAIAGLVVIVVIVDLRVVIVTCVVVVVRFVGVVGFDISIFHAVVVRKHSIISVVGKHSSFVQGEFVCTFAVCPCGDTILFIDTR